MIKGPNTLLSRTRKPGTTISRAPGDSDPSLAVNGTTDDGSPPDMFSPTREADQAPAPGLAVRPSSRRALKNWRLRSRLVLLVTIPTVTAVAGGGVFIASSVQSALVDQRVLTLANLSGKITGLVQALQSEREDTVQYIVLGTDNGGRGASTASTDPTPPGPELSLLGNDYAVTTGWADQVRSLADSVGGSYSQAAQLDAQAAITAIGNLPAIRAAATLTKLPALNVIDQYEQAIDTLLAVESQISVGSSDSTLGVSVSALSLISSMKEEVSEQQALLTSALASDLINLGQFGPTVQSAITDAQAQQQGDLSEFDTTATSDQRQLYNTAVSGSNAVEAEAQEQQAISLASSKSQIATDPTISDASSSLSYEVSGLRSVETQLANAVVSRAGSLRDSAITSAIIFSLAALLLLGIALVATTAVGRSMAGPLRRLRNGALDIAGNRLPAVVRRMSETDGENIPLEVEPIDVDSTDEIGEVARAFDQVHREAVRLAANEAALRGNVNAMFVNLSRRSQSMVERQIRVITQLEQGEQDSKRLASLFQMDHLATRMRRNSENLLVLAGQELSRRWSRPVALVDVLRAAVSEIERYERVTLNVQVDVSVRKEAVSDVVHLTAELVENATAYSAADTPVTVAAYLPSTGGALVEITDQGVGMGTEEMAHANWRLDNPPVVDVAVSRRMGLFVVARLAARHGIRVRLRPGPSGGLIALIWLPDETITSEKGSAGPMRPVSTGHSTGPTGPAGHPTGPTGPAAGQESWPPDIGEFGGAEPPMPRREPGRDHFAGAAAAMASPPPMAPPVVPPAPSAPPAPPAPLPSRERPAMADPAKQPFEGAPWDSGSWATAASASGPSQPSGTEPLSGIGDRLHRFEQAAGSGSNSGRGAQEREPSQGGIPRTWSLAADANSFPGAGPAQPGGTGLAQPGGTGPSPLPRRDGGSGGWGSDGGSAGWGVTSPSGEVKVPPVESLARNERLPIFEAVESHWFRHGRQGIGRTEQSSESWSSPADDGWRAAEVVETPAADGTTQAGLPKRVPRANLVPGTAAAAAADGQPSPAPPAPVPTRSAAEIGGRYSSFQQGIRQGRAAVSGADPDSGEAPTS
jgi:signal transduction histidine kinase